MNTYRSLTEGRTVSKQGSGMFERLNESYGTDMPHLQVCGFARLVGVVAYRGLGLNTGQHRHL